MQVVLFCEMHFFCPVSQQGAGSYLHCTGLGSFEHVTGLRPVNVLL